MRATCIHLLIMYVVLSLMHTIQIRIKKKQSLLPYYPMVSRSTATVFWVSAEEDDRREMAKVVKKDMEAAGAAPG